MIERGRTLPGHTARNARRNGRARTAAERYRCKVTPTSYTVRRPTAAYNRRFGSRYATQQRTSRQWSSSPLCLSGVGSGSLVLTWCTSRRGQRYRSTRPGRRYNRKRGYFRCHCGEAQSSASRSSVWCGGRRSWRNSARFPLLSGGHSPSWSFGSQSAIRCFRSFS